MKNQLELDVRDAWAYSVRKPITVNDPRYLRVKPELTYEGKSYSGPIAYPSPVISRLQLVTLRNSPVDLTACLKIKIPRIPKELPDLLRKNIKEDFPDHTWKGKPDAGTGNLYSLESEVLPDMRIEIGISGNREPAFALGFGDNFNCLPRSDKGSFERFEHYISRLVDLGNTFVNALYESEEFKAHESYRMPISVS